MKTLGIGNLTVSNDCPLTLIAGPCQLESTDHAQMIAGTLKEACDAVGAGLIFKGSFDKANRTSLGGSRGLGMEKGLKVLESVRKTFGIPVLTDVHGAHQCADVADVVDVLQIPAFLCRQTDLLTAAAKTGAVVNVKKGQFLAPWEIHNIVTKLEGAGTENIMLTERGTSFGYNALVVDMRGLPEMMKSGYPVVMDATHAVALPGAQGTSSGGQREFAPVLARAAVSLGIAAVFTETHQDPDNAPCDGPNMIHLHHMPALLEGLMAFDTLAKANPVRL